MTHDQRNLWVERLQSLLQMITELKHTAGVELVQPIVGSHPLVNGLAAIEGLTWGLKDAISRFPVEADPAPAPRSKLPAPSSLLPAFRFELPAPSSLLRAPCSELPAPSSP